ncbi:hypothetical protein Lalb_Chr14g0364701 [Lupinus albus]|uniref:Knottin, scorpion toxin n=1 Tax=Lupinus albus TaxID=3870 RepID=A0A6A4P1C4_LUPAL|nr:hypothetical protein Lalb_Chr14g0364701 [Lupinus albus]
MSLLKFIFLAIVGVLLFSYGMGIQTCIGTCQLFPNCDAVCKERGYLIGYCIDNSDCCCGKEHEE